MKTVFSFLLVLSASYTPQTKAASYSMQRFISERLLPRPVKAYQAFNLFREARSASDSRWLNFITLYLSKDLPIANVIQEEDRYRNLHSPNAQAKNMQRYLAEASHTELDRVIALLSVDTWEVLPHTSRLSLAEVKHMTAEVGEFELGDVSIESMSESEFEDRLTEVLLSKLMRVRDVVSMSADGHKQIIIGLQNLYAAKEFKKMNDSILAAWQEHYRASDEQKIYDELTQIIQQNERLLDEVPMLDSTHKVEIEDIEKELEILQEMVATLDSPVMSYQEATEYLVQKRNVGFVDYNITELYSGVDKKYHTVLEELELVKNILIMTRDLEDQARIYLTRKLKK